MCAHYQCVIAGVWLCSLLIQSCQSQFSATQEEIVPEGPPQHTCCMPPSAYLPDTSQLLAHLTHTTTSHDLSEPSTAAATYLLYEPISEIRRICPENASACVTDTQTTQTIATQPAVTFSQPVSKIFSTSSGIRVRFLLQGSTWQAIRYSGGSAYAPIRTLPVVGPRNIGSFLTWLQAQDVRTSKSHIHILNTSQPPYDPCVYLGKVGLRGGMELSSVKLSLDVKQSVFGDTFRHRFLNRVAFGKSSWTQYFGEVGEEPALPPDIYSILTSPCPFWEHRRVSETHLLVLIPASVNNRPLSLNLLGGLIRTPQGDGHRTQYRYYNTDVQSQIGAASPARSYWVLMTRDVLVGSRNKTYAEQKKLITRYHNQNYALPSALEAAVAILLYHVHSGERLFSDDPWTYTCCQDVLQDKYPVFVGGFSVYGIDVVYSIIGNSHFGVSCCRKL